MKRSAVLMVSIMAALLGSGCFFKDHVAEVRAHSFSDGVSLADAYGALLDNAAWEKIRIDGTTYVQVSGIIKGSAETLTVRYEAKPRPPVVANYEVNGETGDAGNFAAYLYDLHLRRAIMQPEPTL